MRVAKTLSAFVGIVCLLISVNFLSAQPVKHKRHKKEERQNTITERIITQREITVPPPAEVNFTDLAKYELAHPVKHKRRFIEQGEDREHDVKFPHKPVPENAFVFQVAKDTTKHKPTLLEDSPAPLGYWNGVMDNNTLIPPDIQGAAGDVYVLETTNQEFKIYTKSGTLVNTLSIITMFSSTGGNNFFDPHCVYDANYGRYIICIDGIASDGNSGIFIAVSKTNDPTGSWYVYGFDGIINQGDFLDYPLLGYNTNWVVVTVNDFVGGQTSNQVEGVIYVLNRANLYSGTLGKVNTFTDNQGAGNSPAETRDAAQTTEYIVEDVNGNQNGNGYVQIETVTGTANAPVYSVGNTLGINNTWDESNVGATQGGSNNTIEDGDTRMGNVICENNTLWFSHNVPLPAGNPTHCGVDWWQVNPVTPKLVQYGRIEDTNGQIFYYYPSISVNATGDALLGYCTSSPSTYPSAAYSFHASTDAANTMQTTNIYKAGLASYYKTGNGRNRWGDFTGTTTDPLDNSFWNFSEWANTGNNWATVIAHVAASSSVCTAHAAYTYSATTSCSAPFTVNFVNVSTSANTFLWYFGDGDTSSALNPSHTYTSQGTFNVKLVAISTGTCGKDSATIDSLVTISSAIPCVVIMPANGTGPTQTSCTGTLYDDGGPNGNYSDNSNGVITISPTGASNVKLHFTQFAMENTYDFLYVYDGPTTASTLIAAFTGYTIPADITSSGASITLRQSSDQAVNYAGYAISWNCVLPNSPPVTSFAATPTSSCTGDIQFKNLSSGATSWLWYFGDSTTSTLQNPLHTYTANGTYTVSLVGFNSVGKDSVSQKKYITINKPTGPVTTGASGCRATNYTVSAASSDTINWYANLTDSVPLYTGNPFVTPVISNTTTYYAEQLVPGPTYSVGPTNDQIGNYTNLMYSWYEIFNVLKPCTLSSVYVYAQGAGNRTFQLLDNNANVLASTTVNVPDGGSRVTLNFNLPAGNSYQLGLPASSNINLVRNSSGANYPYNDAGGYVSIIGNTANDTARYYYCYDWILQSPPCTSIRTPATVTIGSTVTASISSFTEPTCFGYSNGTATVSSTGGAPTITYKWSNSQTGLTATNLAAGNVSVTVTDANQCSASASKVMPQPAAITITPTANNVSCNGGNNGSITLSVSGGTPKYSFNWGNGITAQNRTGLSASTYNVTVTDSAGCTATATKAITQPSAIAVTLTPTNVSCNGGNNGAISSGVSGGTSPYTYNWGNNITTSNRSNLIAATYTLTVTDSLACSATASKTITQPSAISIVPSVVNVSCNGSKNGSINLAVTGGTGAYTYNWGGGITTQNRTGLSAGNYSVTVTDAANCTASLAKTISQPVALSVILTPTNVLCNGGNNGALNASASGGTTPYVYTWGGGITGSGRTGLTSGTYAITVTDSAGCSATASKAISQPAAIDISFTIHNTVCNRDNGSVTVSANGGTPGYSYLWNTNDTASSISGLGPGNYIATVTDHNNCHSADSARVNYSSSLLTSVNHKDVTCYGGKNGSANVSALTGAPPFNYLWSTGATDSAITNLPAANYTIVVTDNNHCEGIDTLIVNQPAAILVALDITQPSCYQYSNGVVRASAVNGSSPYSFAWSTNTTSDSISNLTAGNYSVSVHDANSCSADSNFTVSSPAAISVSYASNNNACYGDQDGNISLGATGGTSPYNYKWNTGSKSNAINNLKAGIYYVTVTDNHQCSLADSFAITQPVQFEIVASATASAAGTNSGTAAVDSFYNGSSPYTFNWSNGDTTQTISGLASGTYDVTVTDQNGCQQTASVEVDRSTGLLAFSTDIPFSLRPNPANTQVTINIPGLDNPLTMKVYDMLGQALLGQTISSPKTIIDISLLAPGIYSVEINHEMVKTVRQLVVAR